MYQLETHIKSFLTGGTPIAFIYDSSYPVDGHHIGALYKDSKSDEAYAFSAFPNIEGDNGQVDEEGLESLELAWHRLLLCMSEMGHSYDELLKLNYKKIELLFAKN